MGMACETDGRLTTALAAAAGSADTGAHDPAGLMHTALRHRTGAELVASLVPFVDDALRMNDQVYVSLPPYSTERLKAELGRDADRVRWTDSTRWQPHPMRRLRAIRELVEGAERHGVGRLRLVGECPLPPVPTMVTEWERFDALLNDALAGLPATVVCTYDESTLPAGVIGRAACSHPFVGLDPADPSPDYLDPCQYLARHRIPQEELPADAPSLEGPVGPGDARALVRRTLGRVWGTLPAVPPEVVEDMAMAVNELVLNAWQAGSRRVAVRCWRTDGEVGAQVDDDGPGIDDALAGYRRPDPGAERGRGLWLARQLVDVLDTCATDDGTRARVRVFDATWTKSAA